MASGGSGSDRRHNRVTVHDVARAASVSPMTVSRVVNGNAKVDDAMRERVLAAIDELGYQVNLAARAARVGTLRIGLLHSNPSAAFLNAFLLGAMDRCNASGAQLVLEHCDDIQSQRQAIARLLQLGVDGVLIPPPLCDSDVALRQLNKTGMPVVAVATGRPSPLASAVRIDDYEGAVAMTRYLLSIGHTDIAFIKGDPAHTPAQLRHAAFMDTMKAAGLGVAEDRIADGMFTYRSGLEAARRLLGQGTRPTAIFASNDDMAAGAIAVAHGLRLHLPDDLTICGFDDTPVATTVWPELTTVHQPIGDMAKSAIDLLIDQIRKRRAGEASPVRHEVLPFTLCARESSSAVKA